MTKILLISVTLLLKLRRIGGAAPGDRRSMGLDRPAGSFAFWLIVGKRGPGVL